MRENIFPHSVLTDKVYLSPLISQKKVAMSKQLTLEQRYEIQALINAKHRKNFIAKQLGVDKSTITRELQRNSGKRSYNAQKAQELYNERKKDVFRKIRFTESMKKFVIEKIKDCWSPEQITGYCKRQSIPMVSHETIYQFIYTDKEKGGDLYKYLRTARCKRKPKKNKRKGKFSIMDRVFIKERPAIVDAKERFGDWEADTIIGANHKGAILGVVERKSMFALYVKTNGKKSESIKHELINLLAPFKKLVHTITSDNGTEFAEHKAIAKKLQCDFFFADPYAAWQRGLNENTNKLIRQYIPKKTNFENISQEYLNNICLKLNTRPRKKLNYLSPLQVFLGNLENFVAFNT